MIQVLYPRPAAARLLFLDGVYVDGAGSTTRFRWVKAPTNEELSQLTHTIARRVGRFLERQGLLQRDAEYSTLASDAVDDDSMTHLQGHSITYRIAVGPQQGRAPDGRPNPQPSISHHQRHRAVIRLILHALKNFHGFVLGLLDMDTVSVQYP